MYPFRINTSLKPGLALGAVLGFTLAELLIALAIVGILAALSIPKLLTISDISKNSSIVKEAASMLSAAYSQYKLSHSPDITTTAGVVTQYLNYVRPEASLAMNDVPPAQSPIADCNGTNVCYRMHNGGIFQFNPANTFGGTSTTHAWVFNVDPDGEKPGAGGVTLILFFNGRLTTRQRSGAVGTGYLTGGTAVTPIVTTDPDFIQTWN